MSSLDMVQESGLAIRNRKGSQEYIHPLDFDTSIGIGVGLPLTNGSGGEYPTITSASVTPLNEADTRLSTDRKRGGVFTVNYTTKDQVRSNIKNLVLTSPGERHYHPNFGCGVYELLFDNATKEALQTIEDAVHTQVSYWLPYVKLHEVFVTRAEHNPNRVNIGISYSAYNNIEKELVDIIV